MQGIVSRLNAVQLEREGVREKILDLRYQTELLERQERALSLSVLPPKPENPAQKILTENRTRKSYPKTYSRKPREKILDLRYQTELLERSERALSLKVRPHLTESAYKVVLQKSIPAQIR